jgi:hypothetical protein
MRRGKFSPRRRAPRGNMPRMSWRHVLAVVAVLAVAAAAVVVLFFGVSSVAVPGGAPVAPAPGTPLPRRPGEAAPPAAAPDEPAPPRTVDEGVEALGARIAANDAAGAREAAADLRRRIRTDDAVWRAAAAALLDPATPAALREALAFVFGTIDDARTDPLLLDALKQFGATPEFARAALLALGAQRTPPEEDGVFAMGDRPWGAGGPGGLGITVRRAIEPAATRAAVAARLGDAAVGARWAAATALRHSLKSDDARTAFTGALRAESEDQVLAVVGESLAVAARSMPDGADRAALLVQLLGRAGEPPLEGYRFRMENDLAAMPLAAESRTSLTELTGASHDFGVRSFAVNVLTATAQASGPDAVRDARRRLADLLASDRDAPMRDASARLLGTLPADAETLAGLAAAARSDTAWNVRYTAVDTYAKLAPSEARAVLEAAAKDEDERVRERAADLLKKTPAPR